MSRVAKNPIEIPANVQVTLTGPLISVKGPKGQLEHQIHEFVSVEKADNHLQVHFDLTTRRRVSGSKSEIMGMVKAIAGTTRALVNNLVIGVTQGFEKKLSLVGVGYRAQAQGNKLNVTAGFSHPVVFEIPKGIVIETPTQTEIVIKGICKKTVGQVAADIRAIRPPESYKGKGIRYANENVVIKETKKK